ncbi:MAG: HU family DNA-binding protein [Ruminococcus sp.]|nr:HU family DNA-binding protein [Ruminococcus sp.]
MNTKEFTRELARRKCISQETAYRYINSVMDTIRQVLAEGEEIKIGSFGKFTVVTDLEGNKTAMLCSGKSLRQALTAGEGIV